MEIIKKTYLKVPHEDSEISFQYPAFNGTYGQIAEEIDGAGLKRPTSSETASLVYDAVQREVKYESYFESKYERVDTPLSNILKNGWFVEFTGNLYLPRKPGEEIHNGVIIEDNPKIENGKLSMDRTSLIERLRNNDLKVRFVPFGYKIEVQSPLKLAKNPYTIARYGEEGAEKIAELASEYRNDPYISCFESVDSEISRMSVLGENGIFGKWLSVEHKEWFVDNCHAFGIKSRI